MKQVIIIRRDLKMRRGKECSQASHASMAFLIRKSNDFTPATEKLKYKHNFVVHHGTVIPMDADVMEWINTGQTKICLQIHSEEELLKLYNQAKDSGLRSHYITDAGRTEFNGVPTITALAIGPNNSEDIDKITGHLKLY